jgi:hypothetical protein
VSKSPLANFEADPFSGRGGIALFSNFRKCGLKYQMNCNKYSPNELAGLFVIYMAILLLIYSKIHAVLVELYPKWSSFHQKWKKCTQITGKGHHFWSQAVGGIVYQYYKECICQLPAQGMQIW